MHNYSKFDVVLVRYPFSDLSNAKVRPAINLLHLNQQSVPSTYSDAAVYLKLLSVNQLLRSSRIKIAKSKLRRP